MANQTVVANTNHNTLTTPQRPTTVGSQRSAGGHSTTTTLISLNLERPPSQGHTLRRLTCVILGAERSNKDQLLAMLDTLAPTDEYSFGPRMSPALKDLLGSVRDRVGAAGVANAALIPCESDKMGGCAVFADVPSHRLDENLISLTSLADLICLCVSAKYGLADMALKRQGELYARVLLAHSVGVKRAMVVITDTRGVAPAAIENVEKEVGHMFSRCGFDEKLIKIVRGTNSSDVLFESIGSVKIQSKIKYVLEPTRKMKATMIVLQAPGIKTGDVLHVFSLGHFVVRVDSIPTLIDRKTNQVTDTDIAVLKMNQVASLHLSILHPTSSAAMASSAASSSALPHFFMKTAVSAPILAYDPKDGGRVVAMGNIAEITERPKMSAMIVSKQNDDSILHIDEEDNASDDDKENDESSGAEEGEQSDFDLAADGAATATRKQ